MGDPTTVMVYSNGLVHCSVCAPNSMLPDDIVKEVNRLNPSGTTHGWQIADAETFADGTPMPCSCEDDPEHRKHYLMEC